MIEADLTPTTTRLKKVIIMKTPAQIANAKLDLQLSGDTTLFLGDKTVYGIPADHAETIRLAMIAAVKVDREQRLTEANSDGDRRTAVFASDLRSRLLATTHDKAHKTVVFTDLDQVPVGSAGYLSPTSRDVLRHADGWILRDGRRRITPNPDEIFTSHSGEANDAKLVELIIEALVPKHHILVDFEAVTGHEGGDWEHSQPGYDWTTLGNPEVLHHRLDKGELARLYFEIEGVGGLGESDGYSDLDKKIEKLSETAAQELRERRANEPALFDLLTIPTTSPEEEPRS